MCPKFHTNLVFKYTKCHISTNLSKFLKLVDYVAKNYLPLLGLLQQIADSLKKVGLVGILLVNEIIMMPIRKVFFILIFGVTVMLLKLPTTHFAAFLCQKM